MWESAANNCDDCSIKLNFWSNQFTIFEVTILSWQQSNHELLMIFCICKQISRTTQNLVVRMDVLQLHDCQDSLRWKSFILLKHNMYYSIFLVNAPNESVVTVWLNWYVSRVFCAICDLLFKNILHFRQCAVHTSSENSFC